MRLVLTADTHVPKRARDLPGPALGGDRGGGRGGARRRLGGRGAARRDDRAVAPTGRGVRQQRRPGAARPAAGGGPGRARRPAGRRGARDRATTGREKRCAARFPDVDLLVFGHSHIPWDTEAPGGLRLLNPGSPTDRRAQPHATYLTAEVHAGSLTRCSCTACPAPDRPRTPPPPPRPAPASPPAPRSRDLALAVDGLRLVRTFVATESARSRWGYWPRPVSAWSSSIRLDASALVRSSGTSASASRASVFR